MLRTVILAGELGRKFGRQHRFDVSTPAEAIRALCANFKEFASELCGAEERGIAYRVTVDKAPLGEAKNVHLPFSRTFRIVPVIIGAKKGGFLNIILGAALIGISFIPGLQGAIFAVGSFAPSLSSIAFGLGTSMLLGGVSQLLSPQPKAPKPSEQPQNQPSYSFNGPVNTDSEGQCVPWGYGRLIIGSARVSGGITADDYTAAGLA